MGKTADLAMVQKTTIDTFHKEGKSQRVITERSGCSGVTLSALLSKLKYYGLTGLLMQLTLSKLGFRGNLTALTERSQPAIRWRVGEVANRVSCGSFRGGH